MMEYENLLHIWMSKNCVDCGGDNEKVYVDEIVWLFFVWSDNSKAVKVVVKTNAEK